MHTIHILCKSDSATIHRAVVARQAGGCTRHELPRENARMARAAAAREFGGEPKNWHVLRYVGSWESREAAEIVRDHLEGVKPTPAPISSLLSESGASETPNASEARHLGLM